MKNRERQQSGGRGGGRGGRDVKSRLGHRAQERKEKDEDLERQFSAAKDDLERGIEGIKAAKKAAAIIGKTCSFQASKRRRLD